jgi:hypothetical protein
MTIDKIGTVWANGGSTDEPDDVKKNQGFVGGDQPAMERFNWLHNFIQKKFNKVQRERVDSFYTDATDPQLMIATGLWDESWGCGADTANIISGGATKEYRDIKSYINADGDPRILVLDNANTKIESYDPRTKTLASTSGDLSLNLPTGGGQTWEPYSFCTDGTYVYVMFADTNASPDTHQIQSWRISDWAVNAGWAATGTTLPGTGSGLILRDGSVIMANSTKLATCNGWVTCTASSSTCISIINISDGTISASGAGDCPTADNAEPIPGISSDGTNIFFGSNGATNPYICSATIADPTTGCGGANFPLSTAGGFRPMMCTAGPNLTIAAMYSASFSSETDVILRTLNSTDADLDVIQIGQNSTTTPVRGDQWLIERVLYQPVFDGINFWILGSVDNTAADDQYVLLKIDAARLSLTDTNIVRQLGDCIAGFYYVSPDTVDNSLQNQHGLTFDGRDIWSIIEATASVTNSGKIFRLPLALLRN